MSEIKSSYRQIVKTTSIFGGLQIANIMIGLIRSKIVAMLLGPLGMGVSGLLNSSIGLISSLTNLGLETSAVKSISIASTNNDNEKIVKEVNVLRRLLWLTGILGSLITIILSSWLSNITFGNSNYTFAFIWLSITVLLKQLTTGELALLQGLRKIKLQVKANFYGNILGLILTIPMYYYLGMTAIVPSIIVASLLGFLSSIFFSKKVPIPNLRLNFKNVLKDGNEMMRLGFSLSFIGILTAISAFTLQIFISNVGGIVEVGLFVAGFAIINSYVGMVFSAMSTDYFPKLVTISNDNIKIRIAVIQQAVIAILIMTPIVVIFMSFAPFIIKLLYSNKFESIILMVKWGLLAMIFKVASWSMGYILIVKGDAKIFIKTSIFFNLFFLLNNVCGYYFYGLDGLGITFAINYVIHFFGLKIISYKSYNFYFDKDFFKIFISSLFLCPATFLISNATNSILKYFLLSFMVIISIFFTVYNLNKKIDFKELFKNKFRN